jgi:hypothetical protein
LTQPLRDAPFEQSRYGLRRRHIVERRVDLVAILFGASPISENDRLKIGRTDAIRLFKLQK